MEGHVHRHDEDASEAQNVSVHAAACLVGTIGKLAWYIAQDNIHSQLDLDQSAKQQARNEQMHGWGKASTRAPQIQARCSESSWPRSWSRRCVCETEQGRHPYEGVRE